MSLQSVPESEETFFVDVPMFDQRQTNSPYLIDAPEPTIVDTGPANGADVILSGLSELDLEPSDVSYIIPTHAHLDHAGGAGYLAQACENATVVCHEYGYEYLTDETKLDHLAESVERAIGMPEPYGEPTVIDPARCETVSGGELFDLGDRELSVLDAPGHAPHQCCLFDERTDVLFSADANGMRFPDTGHRPTTPPPNFDFEAALETLSKLESIGPKTVCYPHFGPGVVGEGTEEIRSYRQMLIEFVEEVERARTEHGREVPDVVPVLDDRWTHWALSTDVAGVLRYLDENESSEVT